MMYVKHITSLPVPVLRRSVLDVPQVETTDANMLTGSKNLRLIKFVHGKHHTTSVTKTRVRRSVFDVIPQVEISDASLINKSKSLRWVTFLHGKRAEDSVTQRKKEKLKHKFS